MFLVDDVLLFPARGLMRVFREIHEAVEQQSQAEGDQLRAALSDLYRLLEAGRVSAEEFDQQEAAILDRLEELEPADEADDAWDDEEIAPDEADEVEADEVEADEVEDADQAEADFALPRAAMERDVLMLGGRDEAARSEPGSPPTQDRLK